MFDESLQALHNRSECVTHAFLLIRAIAWPSVLDTGCEVQAIQQNKHAFLSHDNALLRVDVL